jgi:hypothetical protein
MPQVVGRHRRTEIGSDYSRCNNNNNNIYLLQLDCYPEAVVILHVNKT